jgi:DHA2 family multidrug resistance protein
LLTGLFGILLAAMTAGLSARVPALALADIQGALALSHDDASWLATSYAAGELAVMPFAAWLAITFSMRRFLLAMLLAALLLAASLPCVHDLPLLLLLRFVHGVAAGSLVPILMMAMLRFLPAPVRLHGLAFFAMTATFAPNISVWLAALSVQALSDWRWLYWQLVPCGLLAAAMVAWGIPGAPGALARLRTANWFGMALGVPGLVLVVVGIDQGVRLDWFASPLILAALLVGGGLAALFLVSEWLHPEPFVRLALLERRNIWMGFVTLTVLLTVMSSAVGLPVTLLGRLQGFRVEQSVPLGLAVSLPQLVLGPCVALLLYRQWVDARQVFAAGLVCLALACWLSADITGAWTVQNFYAATLLHVVGQPLAMTSMLFLIVSTVQAMEGPHLAGLVNIVRVLGSVLAGAAIAEFGTLRTRFHAEMLIDRAGQLAQGPAPTGLAEAIAQQASVLGFADVYRALAVLALALVPFVLCFRHVPAPSVSH